MSTSACDKMGDNPAPVKAERNGTGSNLDTAKALVVGKQVDNPTIRRGVDPKLLSACIAFPFLN